MFGEQSIFGQRVVNIDSKSRICIPAFTFVSPKDTLLVIKTDNIKITTPKLIEDYLDILRISIESTNNLDEIRIIQENIEKIASCVYRKEIVDKQKRICLGDLVQPNEKYRIVGAKSYIYLNKELTK